MSSRRPLAVYSAKRRQRSISNPHTRPSSSPVKQLDLHDGDLSIAEMSRRMMKKSRASLKRSSLGLDGSGSRSAGASPIDPLLDNTRPTKKSRTVGAGPGPRKPLETIVEPDRNRSIVPTECGTMDMDLTGVAEIKTPAPREVPVPNDAHICEESDFLSPLPTPHHARCVIAHGNSSNQLKENKTKAPASSKNNIMLLSPAPQSLASPFHSRPATPNSSRSRIAAKKASANKTLNRTRSVGTDLRRRATMRSYSRAVSPASDASGPALQRHPSLPTSQSLKRQEQDWLVRAQPDQTQTRKSPAKIAEPAVPFVRESSFFNNTPQACSTPGPTAKTFRFPQPTPKLPADVNATPRLPLLFKTKNKAANSNNLSLLDGPTPRARPAHEGPSLAFLTGEDSLFSGSDVLDPSRDSSDVNQVATQALQDAPVQKTRRRMTVHLSQDSIFSSALDFSTSVTVKQPTASSRPPDVSTLSDNTLTEAAVESATIVPAALASPTSSDGDELRDMFSILGLDEDEHWNMVHGSSFDAPNTLDRVSDSLSSSSSDFQATGPRTRRGKKKKSSVSNRASNPKKAVTGGARLAVRADSPISSISRALATRGSSPRRPIRNIRPRPTIKRKIHSDPLEVSTDGDDELLLTSRGWEWDSLANCIVPTSS